MLARYFYFNYVNLCFAKAVTKDQHDFNRAWYREHVHLKDFFHREVKVWPTNLHFIRL